MANNNRIKKAVVVNDKRKKEFIPMKSDPLGVKCKLQITQKNERSHKNETERQREIQKKNCGTKHMLLKHGTSTMVVNISETRNNKHTSAAFENGRTNLKAELVITNSAEKWLWAAQHGAAAAAVALHALAEI